MWAALMRACRVPLSQSLCVPSASLCQEKKRGTGDQDKDNAGLHASHLMLYMLISLCLSIPVIPCFWFQSSNIASNGFLSK